jgi:hypothetical protein
MKCEYCNHIFSSKYVLKNHQRRAKYCLEIQKTQGTSIIEDLFTCEYCNLVMAKNVVQRHNQTCRAILEHKIIVLEDKNKKLEKELLQSLEQLEIYKELAERELDCVESIAKQPRTTNTQTNNNLNLLTPMDLNRESFSKTIKEAFGDNYLLEGQKGIARFAFDKLLKDEKGNLKYVCTDPSRQTYRFKALDGTIERDIKAKKLTSAIAEDVIRHSYTISKEKIQNGDSEVFLLYSNNIMDINDISSDNGNFRNELASLTSA